MKYKRLFNLNEYVGRKPSHWFKREIARCRLVEAWIALVYDDHILSLTGNLDGNQ